MGNPFPTNRALQGGQDGEWGPWTSQASLPEQSQQPAALVSLSLSSVPRLTTLSKPGTSKPLAVHWLFWKVPPNTQPPSQVPGAGLHPHLCWHQGAAASRRQVLPTVGSSHGWLLRTSGQPRTSMQISRPRGAAQRQQEARGGGSASSSSSALPCRAFPGEPRIILPQH